MRRFCFALAIILCVTLLFAMLGGAPWDAEAQCRRRISMCIQGENIETTVWLDLPSQMRLDGGLSDLDRLWQKGCTLAQWGDAQSPGLGQSFEALLSGYERLPVPATARIQGGKMAYTQDRDGCIFDRYEAAKALAVALGGGSAPPLVLKRQKASPTLQQIQYCTRNMSSFATPFRQDALERSHNLALACASLDGVVVPSGATFSFNQTVGPRTAERGYRAAKSIVDGRYVQTTGGGVCQVSTTLYNAALLAGLPAQANRHSLRVHYVEAARDAMVSEYSDMTFVNTTAHPLYIAAWVGEGMVQVRLFGLPAKERVQLYSQILATTPFADVDTQGNLLYDTSGYHLVQAGEEGVAARLMRRIGDDEMVLRQCIYPPQNAVWQR